MPSPDRADGRFLHHMRLCTSGGTGNVDGVSLQMYTILTLGVALWLTYGIIMEDLPMLLANMVTLVLALMVRGKL